MATPFDIIGLTGPAEQVVKLLIDVKTRWEKTTEHPQVVQRLTCVYKGIDAKINYLKNEQAVHGHDLGRGFSQIAQEQLQAIDKATQSATATLESTLFKMDRKTYTFRKTHENEAQFAKLEADASRINQEILALCALMVPQHGAQAARPMYNGPDVFSPFNYVGSIDRNLVLDFTTKEESGEAATCEAKLLSAILGPTPTVAAVAAGIGGVGKTCALTALTERPEIGQRFTGGVYFMTLGMDADENKLKDGLCEFVLVSGGLSLSERMKHERSLRAVVAMAGAWFRKKECLFIIDDVWLKSLSEETIRDLAMLAGSREITSGGNRIAYSTRDEQLTNTCLVVSFAPREPRGQQSKNILLAATGLIQSDLNCDSEFNRVLDACRGLPLALSFAGKYIGRRLSGSQNNVAGVFLKYAEDLELSLPKRIHDSVDATLTESLRYLDEEDKWADSSLLTPSMAVKRLCVLQKQDWVPFSFLSTLWDLDGREQAEDIADRLARFGIVELARSWEKGDYIPGIRVHDLVHDFCTRQAGENTVSYFMSLLDTYQSAHVRSKDSSSANSPFLRSFRSSSHKETVSLPSPGDACWPSLLEDDGYIISNICRLMKEARYFKLLRNTLSDVRWAVKMMERKYIFQYERDVKTLSEIQSGDERAANLTPQEPAPHRTNGTSRTKNAIKFLRMKDCSHTQKAIPFTLRAKDDEFEDKVKIAEVLQKVTRQSLTCSQGPIQKKCFQLYARLQATHLQELWMRKALHSIRQYIPRPCLLPVGPCMSGAFNPCTDLFHLGVQVHDIKAVNEHIYFACGVSDGKTITIKKFHSGFGAELIQIDTNNDNKSPRSDISCVVLSGNCSRAVSGHKNGLVCVWSVETMTQVCAPFKAHYKSVGDVAVSEDASRIVSRAYDYSVRAWDTKSGKAIVVPFIGDAAWVTSIAISGDGRHAVSGAEGNSLRVWDTASGKTVSLLPAVHKDRVNCVAISADGTRVASGSDDCTVRVWDTASGMAVADPFTGHTSYVCSVAISTDGTLVVSGSWDNTVRLWDTVSGKAVGPPLVGHVAWVKGVAFSANGKHIVSESLLDIVRIWDIASVTTAGPPLIGHTDNIRSVEMNAEGSSVVSGSSDKTLRLWDTASGTAIGRPLTGHTAWVRSVAICADGTRVVSGSDDKTLRVWDTAIGMAIGTPLIGHKRPVSSVAISSDGKRIASGAEDSTV